MCKSYICLPKKVDGMVLHERVKIITFVFLWQINHRYISVCSPLINICTLHRRLQQNGISSHLVNILSSILLLAAELSVEVPELWPLPPCLAMSGAERVLKCWKNQFHVHIFTSQGSFYLIGNNTLEAQIAGYRYQGYLDISSYFLHVLDIVMINR